MPWRPTFRLLTIVLAAAGAWIGSACAPAPPRLPSGTAIDLPASMRVQVAGRITTIPLEDYVLGASLSEVTPVGESTRVVARVFEVQSIIARTYAAAHGGRHEQEGFDLCDKTHCQLYQPIRLRTSSFSATARAAVGRTAGRILRFNRRPAQALFHSDCGGHTTTPGAAWGGPALPYLPAAPDDIPGTTHRNWQFVATTAEWSTMLSRDSRTRSEGRLRDVRVASRDMSGRAVVVEIVGTRPIQVSGETFRAVVSADRGPRSIMSTRFEIGRTSDGFRLVGTGFGHGVGLCQVGAIARARRGDSVDAILGHYYPGAH